MGILVKLLNNGLAVEKDQCERVAIEMGEAVWVASKVVVLAEYELVDDVYSVVLVVYKRNAKKVVRCGVEAGINLTPFGVPIIIFPKAVIFDKSGRPMKVMIDAWVSDFYSKKEKPGPVVKDYTEDTL